MKVKKTANPSFTRTYSWTIDKTSPTTALTLATGQSSSVNYTVTINRDSGTDSNWAVSGEITVKNPDPTNPATIESVTDVLSVDGNAPVQCGVDFPYTLDSGHTLTCSYGVSLDGPNNQINTATATTTGKVGSGSGNADVDFANAVISEVDEEVTVTDDKYGSLGTFTGSGSTSYSLTIVYTDCGEYDFINTATFTTNDTSTTGSDSHPIKVTVPCAGGCTLTQGYWKTHSDRGPAPYDDAWKNVGALEEDTAFYLSGKTWYQVFWTPPAGNAYYNLAHQYMAAKLNVLNGASTTAAVDAALAGANTLLSAQGVNDTTLSAAERKLALAYASTLDQYNNGLIGPGHCSE